MAEAGSHILYSGRVYHFVLFYDPRQSSYPRVAVYADFGIDDTYGHHDQKQDWTESR